MSTIPPFAHPLDPAAPLAASDRLALFLDFDGTLVDIAATADAVDVPRTLAPLLVDLRDALDGAAAILTGRTVADVDRLLAPARLAAAGVHGAEFRPSPDAAVDRTAAPLPDAIVARLRDLGSRFPGIRIEDKGATAAVHWRAAPEAAPELAAALPRLVADFPPFEIRRGRKVFEVVPPQISKGAALERMCALERFAGRRPLVIGDDLTDESAIRAAERLGGLGYRVEGETFSPDVADFGSPREVRAWLAELLERIRR